MESLDRVGDWWLPDECEKRIPGKLEFDSAACSRLTLYGQLYPTVSFGLRNPKEIGFLHGEVDGVAFTLQGCYAIASYRYPGINETLIDLVYIYEGHHFNSIDDIVFESVTVSYPYLDDWIDGDNLEHKYAENLRKPGTVPGARHRVTSIDELAFFIGNVPFEPVEFSTDGGREGLIEYRITRSLPDRNDSPKEWKHRSHVTIKPTEISPLFSDGVGFGFSEVVFVCLANFLTLATGRVNDPLSIRGTLPGSDAPSSVSIYCPGLEPEPVGFRKMLFTFDDVKDNLSKHFSIWNDTYAKLREVYDLYFKWNHDLHRGQLSHPTTQFLDMARALEVYHRRLYDEPYICKPTYKQKKKAVIKAIRETFDGELSKKLVDDLGRGNEYTFAKRLESIFDRVLSEYAELLEEILGELHKFQRTVVDTRNDLTHILESPGKDAIDRDDIKTFHEYVTKTRLLLRMCFLVELKLPSDRINQIMNRKLEDHILL